MNMCSKCYRDFQGFGEVKKCTTKSSMLTRLAAPVGEGKKSTLKTELKTDSGVIIQVRHGDMTEEEVDCIVNAANSSLDHACMLKIILFYALLIFYQLDLQELLSRKGMRNQFFFSSVVDK